MRSVHHPTVRCYRHTKWMAYCTDCKAAHAPLLRSRRQTAELSADQPAPSTHD